MVYGGSLGGEAVNLWGLIEEVGCDLWGPGKEGLGSIEAPGQAVMGSMGLLGREAVI